MATLYAVAIAVFLLGTNAVLASVDMSSSRGRKYAWKSDKLQWQVGSWGPCSPVAPADNILASRQPPYPRDNLGVMQRNVSCILLSHDSIKAQRLVDEENCFSVSRKPDPVRFCHVPRPQDCVVGPFSEWSECSACEDSPENMNQTRVRPVLVAPMHGGKPCPALTQSRPCEARTACLTRVEEPDGSRPDYKLKIGEWRRCQAPTSLIPADVREARFKGRSHSRSSFRRSPFSSYMSGGRHNRMYPSSSAELMDQYYTYQPEVGYQTREVSCRDPKGAAVDISLCIPENRQNYLPPAVQPCVVPEDCVVNQWTGWTKLQEGCLAGTGQLAARAEIQMRRREVVRLRQGSGRMCPRLVERRVITDPQQLPVCENKYRWLASKWSPCVVVSDDNQLLQVGCGGGVQLRTVSCVAMLGSQPVPSELCSSLVPLPTVQRCEVACPRDCEVGPWGPWGPCRALDCSTSDDPPQGYRERRRSIEVMASEKGVECPSVKEVQACPQPACYEWVAGQWSPCQLDAGLRHCGEGRRSRSVTCRTPGGIVVSESRCARISKKPSMDEPCLLPCPFDCVLSPWSDWSPCSHSCSSHQQIALRQRNRTVIAPPGAGGHPCPDPDEMLQVEPCNTHSCHGYSWLALPWQPCNVSIRSPAPPLIGPDTGDNGVSTVKGDCGRGIQIREVWCMEANEHHVDDKKCYPLRKPFVSRPCTRPCPVNCQLSPWSEWTVCPSDCVPDASTESDGEVAPIQMRRRVVVQWPAYGGKRCPGLQEMRPCPLSGARCRHYTWGTGDWSECQLPNNVECGIGYRTRAVWCYRNHPSIKVEASFCIDQNGTIPESSEACYRDCHWPCVLSGWSEWSPCTRACSTRQRTRELLGLSSSRPPCMNTDQFPLVETQSCPCNQYDLKILGDWSECILENEITIKANGRSANGVCGTGTRYRRIGCFNSTGHLVEPNLCGADNGIEEEPCFIPCPVDCKMTEWTSWGECSALCGPGLHNRTRKMIRNSMYAGRPCGETMEVKVCNSPCNVYRWVAAGWSECQLIGVDQERGCGTGDQYRQVRCMKETVNSMAVEVPDAYCDAVLQPADVNACHVACPGECVVSPWSDWSDCPKPCDENKERQRTRSILRKPASSDSKCPALIEVQSCDINITCFTYSWQETIFSSCLPLGGSPCGEGVQSRAIYCERSDGRRVDDRWCDDQPKPSPTEKWCYVDCPVDCEVTQWSAWNNSECQCGNTGSAMLRYRYMTTNPSPKGRPCPLPLVQHKPCPAVPCYTWERGQWGNCNLYGAWCGHGTVTRNVTCLRDGEPVENRLCGNAPDLHTTDLCYVPCRGDCQVSEWSHWSHCHRNCQSTAADGYQTRSRAVLRNPSPEGEACPTALWETRPCFSGACLTFDWVIDDGGHLTCKRSDGVVVVGGCEGRPIPCSNPKCEMVPHAYCDTTLGTCICEAGYYAHVAHNKKLTKCVRAYGNNLDVRNRLNPGGDRTGLPDEIQSRYYYPRDDELNMWMFAVIGIGCLFIIFVMVSLYIMFHKKISFPGYCRGQQNQPQQQQQQQPQLEQQQQNLQQQQVPTARPAAKA